MEKMNGEIRDRQKVVRGVKKDKSPLLRGYKFTTTMCAHS
jgi:hypothetical protein